MFILKPLAPINALLPDLPPLEGLRVKNDYDFDFDQTQEPSDPILAAILRSERVDVLPQRLEHSEIVFDVQGDAVLDCDTVKNESIWDRALAQPLTPKNSLLTWDALHWPGLRNPREPAFVSELDSSQFDAVLYHVDGGLGAQQSIPSTFLAQHLLAVLTGCSSELFVWNATRDAFVMQYAGYAMHEVRVESLDSPTSRSFIARFLLVGSLLRRMEAMVDRFRVTKRSPAFYEFLHAVNEVLTWLKISLGSQHPFPASHLTSIWFHYQQQAKVLLALAELCERDMARHPPYPSPPDSDSDLLSRLYHTLQYHMDVSSPRPVQAVCAYLLQCASRSYIAQLEELVGMTKAHTSSTPQDIAVLSSAESMTRLLDGEVDDDSEHLLDSTQFAAFVPAELTSAISLAQKTLRILRSANIEIGRPDNCSRCCWQWVTEDAIPREKNTEIFAPTSCPDTPHSTPYEPQLSGFRVFDMEPGSHTLAARLDNVHVPISRLPHDLIDFVISFPAYLTPSVPTLRQITFLTLQPLLDHSRMLSRTLLSLFLEASNLHTHLVIVRQYLLLTGCSFKRHLVTALFTHSAANIERQTSGVLQIRRRTVHRNQINDGNDSQVHGVGLNLGGYGTTHADWPPGAADISFSLRRVIADALDDSANTVDILDSNDAEQRVWTEAESRLGFALRDIPDNAVTEAWFDPDGLDALDFLYLAYRPPHPLDELVLSNEAMSKYQRIFSFLLRVLRVEQVSRMIHNVANSRNAPSDIFSMLPPSRQLLSRFSFQVQTFIAALSSYVFEVAIGKTFDEMLSSISKLRSAMSSGDTSFETSMDVFALSDYHSSVLDQILSACLLRNKQTNVCEALRNSLTVIVDLGRMIARVDNKELPEILAAQELDELYQRYVQSMTQLVTLLHALIDKTRARTQDGGAGWRNRYVFTVDVRDTQHCLSQLLMRIDGNGWWKSQVDKQNNSL